MKNAFQTVVSQHAALFPLWELDDLYKLVFQAAMGSEHGVADPDGVYDCLRSEAMALTPNGDYPLVMPISPDQRLVRVGVAPYLSLGGDLHDLAHAFVQTAQSFQPSRNRLARYWSWVEALAVERVISMTLPELKSYMDKRRSQGYPPVHHSDQYRRWYHPAYRVVLREVMALP